MFFFIEKEKVIKNSKVSFFSQIKTLFKGQRFLLTHKTKKRISIDDKVLFVRQSPEPNDIIWENLGLSLKTLVILKIKSTILTIALWICCICIIGLIKWFQLKVLKDAIKDTKSNKNDIYSFVEAISFLIGIIIICFNKFILGRIVKKIVRLQK